MPYHLDLVRELALAEGQGVLIARAAPGRGAAVARAVATRPSSRDGSERGARSRICHDQVEKAGFTTVKCERADLGDVGVGGWDAIVCAFGLWTAPDRATVLKSWASSLAPHGKVGVLTFGPPDESDPFEILARALRELEPNAVMKPSRIDADREGFAEDLRGGRARARPPHHAPSHGHVRDRRGLHLGHP